LEELTKIKFSDLLLSVEEIRADKALFAELLAGKREFYQLETASIARMARSFGVK